ncbi:tyrosine-protein kinase SYK-like isoform X2 [Liolophura sinensis]|uniref:tyrosine-protein kinase SYK-like isoform X2 n=1 Tax=Liolophura sinensis TaxID=3198878 RepID=UPI00315909D0
MSQLRLNSPKTQKMAAEPIKEVKESAFFFGRITRDESEAILQNQGHQEGLYLLRESITPVGNYVISICHKDSVHHYSVERQLDGTYMIQDGKKFKDPLDLLRYHNKHLDGFLTHPKIPCSRSPGTSPLKFRGITYEILEQELKKKVDSMKLKGKELEKALGRKRDQFVSLVAKELHKDQPWYHGYIERDEAESRLHNDGHEDGKFLVRERRDRDNKGACFALSISFGEAKHYIIEKDRSEHYFIDEGPKFENLMLLIDHYYNKQAGLICKLKKPCCRPDYDKRKLECFDWPSIVRENPAYPNFSEMVVTTFTSGAASEYFSHQDVTQEAAPPLSQASFPDAGSPKRKLPSPPDEEWEVPQDDSVSKGAAALASSQVFGEEDAEAIYGRYRRREPSTFTLQPEHITLEDSLGAGNFGSVMRGRCRTKSGEIPVAVKTLKQEHVVQGQEPEIIREAKVMQNLDHRNIVRLIGVCKGESIMLVMEIAPLGPLNKYVQRNKNMPVWNLLHLLHQVAMGMEYLESKKFVHRDLAARNVLLLNPTFAKISDFGMSKAVGSDSDYYKANCAGKWPLKWYAPECIQYFKFDSKSDVWSYGVTLWEVLSYGEKPYRKMNGQQMLTYIHSGRRLPQPQACDEETYGVMLKCWQEDKAARPSFSELVPMMKNLHEKHKLTQASGIGIDLV